MRRTGRDHDQRARGRVVDLGPDGEPRRAGHDVEALVVLGVAVLRWSLGVRGEGDLADTEPVPGGVAVLQDAHLGCSEVDHLAVARSDY